jgi:hypothetical protein
MTSITDPEVDSLIVRLRADRRLLDELNAEHKRLRDERRVRWNALDGLSDALKANPSRETCDAYFEVTAATNALCKREDELDGRRHTLLKEMLALHQRLHVLLGIEIAQADFER